MNKPLFPLAGEGLGERANRSDAVPASPLSPVPVLPQGAREIDRQRRRWCRQRSSLPGGIGAALTCAAPASPQPGRCRLGGRHALSAQAALHRQAAQGGRRQPCAARHRHDRSLLPAPRRSAGADRGAGAAMLTCADLVALHGKVRRSADAVMPFARSTRLSPTLSCRRCPSAVHPVTPAGCRASRAGCGRATPRTRCSPPVRGSAAASCPTARSGAAS